MRLASGMRNSPYLIPLIAFLIVLVFFLLYEYHYSGPDDTMMKRRSTYESRKQELVQVLRKATMSDRTVILTMVNESWASPGSILDVFLEGFKHGQGTHKLLNHLVIITIDPKAYEYCRSLHPHCVHPSTFAHYFAAKTQSITDTHHSAFSWRRNNVLLEILDLGYNIVFTEADVLWLRSPFPQFNPIHELSISCNSSNDGEGGNYLQDGGIFFLKANAIALEFFKYWKVDMVLYPKSYAQESSLCTTITQNQDSVSFYGFRVKYVDTTYFGGFCHLNKYTLKEAYTIHANCCDDITSKVHDLRIVLGDWINSRKNVSGDSASDKNTLMRPRKCIGWKSS